MFKGSLCGRFIIIIRFVKRQNVKRLPWLVAINVVHTNHSHRIVDKSSCYRAYFTKLLKKGQF